MHREGYEWTGGKEILKKAQAAAAKPFKKRLADYREAQKASGKPPEPTPLKPPWEK